jgi:ankyrin repeat protein
MKLIYGQDLVIVGRRLRILFLVLFAGALLGLTVKAMLENKDLEHVGKAESLNAAIEAGDIPRINSLIVEDRSILRACGVKSTTPLNCAVRKGSREIAELLLRSGADVNGPDELGLTPLHCAAGEGNTPMLRFLISTGARVNATAHGGVTPLHMAVNSRSRDVVELLVTNGADLTVKSITPGFAGPSLDKLYTPLQWAVKTRQTEVANILRSKGAKE